MRGCRRARYQARQVLGVQTVQKTLEAPQLQFIDEGSCRWNLQLQVPAVFSAKSEGQCSPFLRAFFGLRPFGTLGDWEFLVVRGSGAAGALGV